MSKSYPDKTSALIFMPLNEGKHDIIPCILCQESFTCLCNRASQCPCSQVNLTRDEAEWIGWQTGGDCVCITCLTRLRQQARAVMQ